MLHLLPHWNWKGKEGQSINVWAYSNCDEVELFLNGKTQGKKAMSKNGHLEWTVPYSSGTLKAIGYTGGKQVLTETVQTTGTPQAIALEAHKNTLKADAQDIAVIKVSLLDKKGLAVPDANNEVSFKIEGPGRIIGVGNGNPTSLEPDKYLETIVNMPIEALKELPVPDTIRKSETAETFDDSGWKKAFTNISDTSIKAWVYRGSINLTDDLTRQPLTFFYKSIGRKQSVYFNGHLLAANVDYHKDQDVFNISKAFLKAGKNSIVIVALPIKKVHPWDNPNQDPGVIQFKAPAAGWKRKLFNGLAQVIIQSDGSHAGPITLTATSAGLKEKKIVISADR
jgi:beta-galactosidase